MKNSDYWNIQSIRISSWSVSCMSDLADTVKLPLSDGRYNHRFV